MEEGQSQSRVAIWEMTRVVREYMHAYMLSRFSRVQLCATLWTAAHQAPLSTGFCRQEYWSGLPFPSPSQGRRWLTRVTAKEMV